MSLTLGWRSSQNFVPKSTDKININPLIRRKKCCLDGLVMLITDLTSSLSPWTYHKEATNYFLYFFLTNVRSFRWNICCVHRSWCLLYFQSSLCRWRPSSRGPILLFPLEVLLSSLEFSFRASKGICSCCEGLHPLGPNFSLFKDHCFFIGSSSLPCSNSLMEF
jgi:hypothetical protein